MEKLKRAHTQLFFVYLQTLAAGVLENLDEDPSNLALPQGVSLEMSFTTLWKELHKLEHLIGYLLVLGPLHSLSLYKAAIRDSCSEKKN